jgi:chemotaxis signal transduction protein
MMRLYENFSEQELVILRTRAERIASPIQSDKTEESVTILSVNIHGESFALPMDAVSAVYDNVQITPVPNVPPFALGITNIRGHVIFVLDLGLILGIPGIRSADGKWAIVVLDGDLGIAFQADSIQGIESLATGHLTKDIPNLALAQNDYLQGLSPDGKALLNVQSILDDLVALAESTANVS